MDIISHALWANLVFKDLPQRPLAIAFSVMPDFISFARVAVKIFFQRTIIYQESPKKEFPPIVYKLYNFTHSLMIWSAIFFLLKLLNLDYLMIAFYGWGLHIMLDIFTHSENFFPTPILWPLSDFHFSGINWSNRNFMIFNYTILAFSYLLFYF